MKGEYLFWIGIFVVFLAVAVVISRKTSATNTTQGDHDDEDESPAEGVTGCRIRGCDRHATSPMPRLVPVWPVLDGIARSIGLSLAYGLRVDLYPQGDYILCSIHHDLARAEVHAQLQRLNTEAAAQASARLNGALRWMDTDLPKQLGVVPRAPPPAPAPPTSHTTNGAGSPTNGAPDRIADPAMS